MTPDEALEWQATAINKPEEAEEAAAQERPAFLRFPVPGIPAGAIPARLGRQIGLAWQDAPLLYPRRWWFLAEGEGDAQEVPVHALVFLLPEPPEDSDNSVVGREAA